MAKSDQFRRLKRFDGVKPVVSNFFTSIRVTVSSITLLTAVIVCGVVMFCWVHLARVPNLAMLENYNPGAEIQLYDINDKLVCTFPAKEKRVVVDLSAVSAYAIKAVLAAEDHYFYEHNGVSATGILRAAVANISAGRPVQGGSTLTQQLVKNVFYEKDKRTLPLKLAEGIVASEIERRYGKEKILEIYLNQIYFGNAAYGIQQAARTYFGKPASQLSASESAFLAGLIKSPSYLGDPAHIEQAIQRQKVVLGQMNEYAFITPLEFDIARCERLFFNQRQKSATDEEQFVPPYPYYASYVADYVKASLTYTRHKGLKVYTYLDTSAQKSAESVLANASSHLPRDLDQAALVSLRLSDGAVLSMVGGLGEF
ncbi:MAG: penicillin-binding protein, partial [Candidatus Obscuribacterales bacterium]|nr:penicillin-binding protein [Candidatus Obscuribacterales bacterium]